MDDFRRSPFLPFLIMKYIISLIRRVLYKIRPQKPKPSIPNGAKDEPSEENWLRGELLKLGFRVLEQYRADNHVPWGKNGEGKFWRWFADRFIDPRKYGHCTILICTK